MGESGNLKDQLERRKRINRLKNGIILTIILWMLATVAAMIFLIVRVARLEKEINALAGSQVYSGQVTSDENAAGEEATYYEIDATGQEEQRQAPVLSMTDLNADNLAEDGEPLKVYLTFDDGPSSNTDEILDILNEYGVKATFFVIGKEDEESTEAYKRIVEEGHTLGMHSYSHKYSAIYSSLDDFETDFYRLQDYLKEVTGVTSVYYRFPGGSSNQVSNTDMGEFIEFLDEQDITYFDWNVSSGDATSQAYTAEEIVDNVLSDVVKYKTSVVLLHDSDAKDTTVEALEPLIEALQGIDAEILPIDQDTTPIQYMTIADAE